MITEEHLKAIDRRYEAARKEPVRVGILNNQTNKKYLIIQSWQDIPASVAEVRRLQALLAMLPETLEELNVIDIFRGVDNG